MLQNLTRQKTILKRKKAQFWDKLNKNIRRLCNEKKIFIISTYHCRAWGSWWRHSHVIIFMCSPWWQNLSQPWRCQFDQTSCSKHDYRLTTHAIHLTDDYSFADLRYIYRTRMQWSWGWRAESNQATHSACAMCFAVRAHQ